MPITIVGAELAAEVYEVANQLGVRPEPFDAVTPALYYPRSAQNPAMLQYALDQKQRSEIDNQIVPIVAHANQLGLLLPLTRRLVELIHALELGRSSTSWRRCGQARSSAIASSVY